MVTDCQPREYNVWSSERQLIYNDENNIYRIKLCGTLYAVTCHNSTNFSSLVLEHLNSKYDTVMGDRL